MKILIVEDEAPLRKQIVSQLKSEGFTIDEATNGSDGQFLGETENYAAIVLDLGLPEIEGSSVLRNWRDQGIQTPVLILTARSSWRDRVEGLNAGGDDYLGKPFRMEELIARLRALIRRSSGQSAALLQIGDVELDIQNGSVTYQDMPVTFTANELKLLTILMMQPQKVHAKSDLAEQIYGYFEERDSNTVEVFISRIRKKLGANFVVTLRGRGYIIGDVQ